MPYQDEPPENLPPGELDARYGKPKKMPLVTAVLGVVHNLNHDIVTVEILKESGQRYLLPFGQGILRQFIDMCAPSVEGHKRPRVN